MTVDPARHGRPIKNGNAADLFARGRESKDEDDIPPPRIMRPQVLSGIDIPPRRWLVPEWVPWGSVTGLYGAGGLGKTLIAQQLQTSTAVRATWLGMQTTPVRSLAMYCEDADDELWRRQADINKTYGCSFQDLEAAVWMPRLGEENLLVTFGRSGTATLTKLHGRLVEAAKDHRAELVIVDTVADTFGGNENDRGQVRQYVSYGLGSIARAIGGSVLCLAHPSRSGQANGDGGSGSTGWDAAFRSRLYLHEPEIQRGLVADPDARVLTRKKANYAARNDAIELKWRNGALVRTAELMPDGEPIVRPTCSEVFLTLLDATGREGRPVSDSGNASNYAPKLFADRPERCGYRKPDFRSAMEWLFSAGRIRVVDYGRAGDRRRKIQRCEAIAA